MMFSYAKKITSFVSQGKSNEALILFHQLQKTGSEKISEFVLSSVVRACGIIGDIQVGEQTHCLVWKHGFNRDTVLSTSILDMYSKSYKIEAAQQVFVEMPEKDVVATNSMIFGFCQSNLMMEAIKLFNDMSERDVGSWNSLISGLEQNSEGKTALLFFEKMRLDGAKCDIITIVSVLSACAGVAAVINGKKVHGLVVKSGFELYLPAGNAVIDMYTKCGYMKDAYSCFFCMPLKNVVSWTCLIVGYGKHGLGLEALKAFDQMEMKGVKPNKITFLGALYACSHTGLVEQGWSIFNTMTIKYSIVPTMEHYTCMVDLLARAGQFKNTQSFIDTMPIKPDAKLLTAFLSACCSHKNLTLARDVGKKLLELEPEEPGAYMLLSNLYGLTGDLQSVANVRRLMLNKGLRKEKASTWIEINRKVHRFESGDKSHPLSKEICNYLQILVEKMKIAGYRPNTSTVMQNVDEHTKEEIVLHHSEKLAIAFGLISTSPGTRITVVKNLRVCVDCHEVSGLISRIENREIVARDLTRFHHFKDGICSCGNHW